jgi:hypothetical protein
LDVEDFGEYTDLAKEIIKALPVKLTIYVDMAEIQKRWSRVCTFFFFTVFG